MASYRRPTCHGVNYTVNHTKLLAAAGPPQCSLLLATVRGNGFYAPCVDCFEAGNDYYSHYGQKVSQRLLLLFPNIPSCCAEFIVNDFLNILRAANKPHRCPDVRPAYHRVAINVEAPSDASLEAALIRASFDEAGPTKRPATKVSVGQLVKPTTLWDNCNQCAICIERMETRSSLEMPCKHAFHEACLVKWLDIDHVCPMCRYKMPSD